jgi:beta-galactosidase
MNKLFIVILLCFASELLADVNTRIQYSINENWRFVKEDKPNASQIALNDSEWQKINIPHTWNAVDVADDAPGYYRGISWYRKEVFLPELYTNKLISMYFEGANQEVELFVNGESAGTHVGGYTRFSFDITKLVRFGEQNIFAIKVNNRYNENIPPLSADFTFFGGLYRDVFLVFTNKIHISTSHYASAGVYFQTPKVNSREAQLDIKTLLTNATAMNSKLRVEHTIVDPQNKTVLVGSKNIQLAKNATEIPFNQSLILNNPQLWSPDSPSLYKVIIRIYKSKTNELLDEISQPLGLRWYAFSTDNGFLLNGKPLKLIGTNRHQDFDKLGNAVPDEIHVRDVKLLKEMGGNFLRISHYPQDPVVMEMCDKLGIITSVEIPIVNAITENDVFSKNSIEMAREMVFQDYNRPSVLIWAYMNEVLLRLPFKGDSIRNKQYFESVNTLAQKIENQIRTDDPQRYTLIPMHGNFNDYHEAGLTQIPKIIGWNLYQGWYGGKFEGFDTFLDNAQAKLKGKPFIITEYGADVDPRLHSFEPQRFDYTQEYANLYHEHYIKAIMERKYVVGANIWNLNDFYSEERENAVPHVNSKGITTLSREPKDTYLQYQAMLSTRPIVNIGGQLWKIRGGNADANNTCMQPIKVYTNSENIELFLNGKSLGNKKVNNNIAQFEVPFVNGANVLEAVGQFQSEKIRDLLQVDFRMISADLKSKTNTFNEMNIMLGSKRYFEEKENSTIWLPEKEYQPGSWGYVGGINYVKRTKYGQQPASDSDILGTNIDPVFQTMRVGIQAFKADVPDGEYTVSLYFADLQAVKSTKMLVYNLGNEAIDNTINERIFDVSINKTRVISNLNIAAEFGGNTAVVKKFTVLVQNGQGISVDFGPITGEAFLNAIRVYRNY